MNNSIPESRRLSFEQVTFQINFHTLQLERDAFELEMYDYLVNPFLGIPDSFWEPINVSFENVNELEDIIKEDTCYICSETHLNFKKVNCCNQEICNGCCYKWFKTSVKCPYCYQDLREFNLKNPTKLNLNES
uniref:RING-type domain-containing protein n=1 Tax=viral metagenome TaxID=1070528 RepID=A0A6C0AYK6_9ZZZZ